MASSMARRYRPSMTQTQKPSLAMIGLRAALFVGLGFVWRGMIVDALRGHPTVWSIVVIAIVLGLAAEVILDLRKRYA
jgi:hypothetical protein